MIQFLFDLDGTITKAETLPFIAQHFHIHKSMEEMTRQSILGNIPFEESFTKRVDMLKHLPVNEIASLLENIPLFSQLLLFIQENKNNCALVTSNLSPWVEKLCSKIACKSYTSSAELENNQIIQITHILAKEEMVKKYQNLGYHVVFIGDGNNDLEAMKCADTAIACGLLHTPPQSLLDVADHCIYDEKALYTLLCELAQSIKIS